uniref:NADH-ubiquinone oxidoreductase chain 3 n=1 Tax=Schizopera knabeni TaxID=1432316 RepID=W8DNB0_9MAXI|nr:NADH dehydrogenase subunit 3 [Schizopera knabeni]
MMMLISLFSLVLFLSLVVLSAGLMLGLKSTADAEKTSPFECGFVPHTFSRSPFSLHFFLISILFLIFDIELVLLFPFFTFSSPGTVESGILLVVLILLTWGVFIEWSQKMLDWVN